MGSLGNKIFDIDKILQRGRQGKGTDILAERFAEATKTKAFFAMRLTKKSFYAGC
jgi:hypothetical protein